MRAIGVWCLVRLGMAFRSRGDYPAAERVLNRALALAERLHRHAPQRLAVVLNSLAMPYKDTARYVEAGILYRRALALLECGDVAHPMVASLHHNLAGLEHARRNYEAGEAPARMAVS